MHVKVSLHRSVRWLRASGTARRQSARCGQRSALSRSLTAGWLLASATASAQEIGTWSADRSPYGIATSEHFDELRTSVLEDFPRARFVPLHSLPSTVLSQLDVLILDGQGDAPLSEAEQDALAAFVARGGVLLAQGSGPMGPSLGARFGVAPAGGYDGAEPSVTLLPPSAFGGPFGLVGRYGNRYDGHLTVTTPGAVTVGDEKGAHLAWVAHGAGHALFFGNLFALADRDFEPGGLFGDPDSDNAALVSNLIARALPAPRIGAWSLARSDIGLARSEAFDVLRGRIRTTLPGAALVELDRLDGGALQDLDVLFLDSTIQESLTIDEFDALAAFVQSGGSVVAQLYGATGNAIAGMYGLAVRGTAEPSARSYPLGTQISWLSSGLFGAAATYQNRYEIHIVDRGTHHDGIPLAADDGGTRLVYVPAVPSRHGSALLFTNLFAFGDPDWSVGGLAAGNNDNIALLGNFLASLGRALPGSEGVARLEATAADPEWAVAYRLAAQSAVRGELGALRTWLERHRDAAPSAVVLRTAEWLAAPQDLVDPRFFPDEGVLLGESRRKDLLAAKHKPDDVSKWTFDVGTLGWTCLEGRKDHCFEVKVRALPPAWEAAGLSLELSPEQLYERFDALGYRTSIGVASVSPFGRQVVASGFGVLWQADYTPRYQGEELIVLTGRRVAR